MAISLAESVRIGLADIMTRKIRTVVTVVGIIMGVMCIMVVLAIVKGMNNSTLDWMNKRGGLSKIEIQRNWNYDFSRGGEATFSITEMRRLKEMLPEAAAFNSQVTEHGARISRGDADYEGRVLGVLPDMVKVEDWAVDTGRFFTDADIDTYQNVAVLGSTVARELFGNREALGQYVHLKGVPLMVVGVLTEKYWKQQGNSGVFGENALEYMNRQTFIPLSTMLAKISPGQSITSVDLQASSPAAARELRQKAEGIVLNMKLGKRLFRVSSAQEQMDEMKRNMMIFSAVFMLIAVISLLVGGIVIMNIMLASIKERTREIGVRIAIGARPADILIQFLVQTVLITSLGGVFGLVFGWMILGGVGNYLNVTVAASPQMVVVALLVSVGVGLVFGIVPAVRAGRLDPVTALREE